MELLRAVKAINSQWDVGMSGMASDGCGHHYEIYYIKGGATIADYKAVAKYTGLIQWGYSLYKRLF